MGQQADGSIIVDTEIDPEGFRAGSAELQRAIKSLSTTINNLGPLFQKALSGNEAAVTSFNSKVDSLKETITQLEAKMEALGTKTVPTDQYSDISTELDKLEAKFDQLMDKQEKMQALGVSEESQSWKSLQYDIEQCGDRIRALRAEKEQLEASGQAFTLGSETAEYQKMANDLAAAKAQLSEMQSRLADSGNEAARLDDHARSVSVHIGNAAKTAAGKLVFGIRQAASSMWRMVTHGRSMNGQFDHLISGAKKFALSLLGARGVYALLRKAVSAYMEENQQLSNNLKNCWSGIGNILGPLITRLINLVSTAVAYVTSFLRLFGVFGSSAAKAISKAGGAASGAAKELQKQLASFDELNILSDNSSDGGGGAADAVTDALAKVELPDWVKLMVDQIKSGEWAQAGATLAGVFNGWIDSFDWPGWGKRLGNAVQNGISFALSFMRNVKWEGLGTSLAQFLNSLRNSINPADLGALLASKVAAAIKLAHGFLTEFDFKETGRWLFGVVKGWFDEISWDTLGEDITLAITGLFDGIAGFFEDENKWKEIGKKIGDLFSHIDWGKIWESVQKAAKEAFEAVGGFFGGINENGDGLVRILEAIGIALAAWKIGSSVATGVNAIKGLFGKKMDGAGNTFKIPSVKTVLTGLADLALIIGGMVGLVAAIGALMKIEGFSEAMTRGLDAIKTAFVGIAQVGLQIAGVSAGVVILGKIGIATITQGFLGLAEILAGVPIVLTAVGALMSIPGFSEFLNTGAESIKTAFTAIGDVGLQIAGVSAIIVGLGFATPATVLSGLAGFALIIGGVELILVALGALAQIPGFSWIVGEGGKVLLQLGEILGGFAGSIIEGAMTKISEGFPKIADNLSLFAKKLEPFLSAMERVDGNVANAAKNLAAAILEFSAASLIDAVTSWITGGKSLVDFGDQLAQFGPKFAEYAKSVAGIDPDVVTASASAAQSLVALAKELPGSGGLLQMLMGEKDIGQFGTQLALFGSYFKRYYEHVKGIDPDVVTASASAAQSLVELAKEIPAKGGLWQFITGEKDIGTFGESLLTFGKSFAAYAKVTDGITPDVVSASVAAAESVVALAKDIPTSGGLAALLFGDSGMGTFGANLKSFGESFFAYYASISGIDMGAVTGATSAISGLILAAIASKDVDNGKFKDFGKAAEEVGKKLSGTDWAKVGKDFSSGLSEMLTSLNSGISGMKESMKGLESDLTTVWANIVTTSSQKWEDARGKIKNTNDSISRDTTQKWSDIKRNLDTSLTNIRSSVQEKMKLVATEVQNAWKTSDSETTLKLNNMKTTVTTKAGEIQKAISDAFSTAKKNAVDRTSEMASGVTSAVSGLASRAYTWGADIARSLANGMSDNKWRVTNSADALAGVIRNYLHFSEPDVGPLSDFHTYMPDMLKLMAKGIGDNKPLVIRAVSGVAEAISEEMNAGVSPLKTIVPVAQVDGALSSFSDRIEDSFTALLDRLQAIAENVTFQIPAAAYSMVPYKPAASAIVSGSAEIDAIEASNDELGQVFTQVIMNAVERIVAAIQRYSGTKVNIDKNSITQMVIEEINRRAEATGRSPIKA